jgi:hypothetical protein
MLPTTKSTVALGLNFALLVSCAPCNAKKSYHDEGGPSTGAIVAGVGAAVAAVGGLIWALQPDDPETVLNKSQSTYRELFSKYEEWINKICRHAGAEARFIDETVLYCALANIRKQCISINSNISNLSDTINTVEKAIKRAKSEYLKDELYAIADKLSCLKKQLVEVEEFLSVHRTYFDLFEVEANLLSAHARELDTYARFNARDPLSGRWLLPDAFHSCLNLRYCAYDAQWKYPYYAYALQCSKDIKDLEYAISRVASCHYGRLCEACKLLNNLKALHQFVVNAPEYQQNIRAREQERIERERLELERARLRAEQERARAEQERVNLEHARLCAERERVAIENARLREERLNNMRHYCSICAHEWYSVHERCNCHCCCG